MERRIAMSASLRASLCALHNMDADIDGAHFAIHVRMVRVLELVLSPRARDFVRYLTVANCIFCCSLLLFLHLNYVGKAECFPKLLNQTEDYHILQIKISSLWTKFSEELKTSPPSDAGPLPPLFMTSKSSINLGDLLYRSLSLNTLYGETSESQAPATKEKSDSEEKTKPQSEQTDTTSSGPTGEDTLSPADASHADSSLQPTDTPSPDAASTTTTTTAATSNKKNKKAAHWADMMIEELALWQDPVYVYSKEKGYLYLSSQRKAEHGVKTLNITLHSDDPCLNPGHLLLEAFIGYDTVILNNIVGTLGGKGYAYNKQTYELWSLNYIVHEAGTIKLEDYIMWKLEVAFRAILLFVVSATLVSFCMKHIQIHVFQFTMQMRHQGLLRSSLVPVIVGHLVESSVLILVMVGVLLCVSEFMSDKTISLLVLFLLWFTELFTLLAIRTQASLKYFPRFVMCCFLLFYLYIFSYPLGFHYMAYLCLCFSLEVLMVYFYIVHEMPAVLSGHINYSRTRAFPIQSRPLFMLIRNQNRPPQIQPIPPPPPLSPPSPPPPPPAEQHEVIPPDAHPHSD